MIWLVAALTIAANILNIYKNRWCFVIWTATNAVWVVYDLRIGAIEQAVMFAVYLLLSLWGLWQWRKGTTKIGREIPPFPKTPENPPHIKIEPPLQRKVFGFGVKLFGIEK